MIRFPNGGDLFDFQKDASSWLLDHTLNLLNENNTLIVKAPTGSGKTIILLNYIDQYLDYTHDKVSFVWLSIGAGELEEQSKDKMDSLLPDRNSKTLGDALLTGFNEGDVTFINWEAVNRAGNKATRIGEMKNIIDRIAEAHKKGISFILIVDEEHRSNTGNSAEFMMHFSASNVIRVSATPIQNDTALKYEIPESEVIASGLITSAMYVNDGVSDDAETDMSTEYKAHVKYLEGRLYEIANQVDRYIVMNTQKPTSASIAIDEQAEMEDFIDNVSVLTYGMGHKVFEPLIKKEGTSEDLSDKQVFAIKTKNNSVDAKMVRTIEGYVVLKGSKIRESDTKSTPSWAKKKRAQLISEGTIKDGIFTRDELFHSPSGASDLVTGNSTSGNKMWKTEAGITLGEILEKEK